MYKFSLCIKQMMINAVGWKWTQWYEPCLMAQVESSSMFIGIVNPECAVLLPGSNSDAIPLDATFSTMPPDDRTAADSDRQMKVFPVPPYP